MTTDHKAAKELASQSTNKFTWPEYDNLKACYLELRELAKAVLDEMRATDILKSDNAQALRSAIGE